MNTLVNETEGPSGTREVSDVNCCPACGHHLSHALERIELGEQHSFYTRDVAVQKRLTFLAGIPGNGYQMRRCKDCGLEFADPRRAPAAAWYEVVYQTLDLYPAARWEFDYVLDSLKPGDTVGEIGCGSGEFLKKCWKRGIAAAGVDFSPGAVEACRAAGLEAGMLDLSGTASPPEFGGRHNVVVAFQVLEHLDQARSLFALARQWTSADATLWIAIPSDRRPSRFYQERDHLDQPPHHMTRWTESALAAIADGHGWKMVRVIYEPIEMGAKVWWASTRHPLYRFLQRRRLLNGRLVERLLRLLLAPFAWISVSLAGPALSGQSMMAECRKKGE